MGVHLKCVLDYELVAFTKDTRMSWSASEETLPRGSMYQIIRVLGFWVIVIIVQVLGMSMIIRYLDP